MSLAQDLANTQVASATPAIVRIASEISRQRGHGPGETYEVVPGIFVPVWVKYENDARAMMKVISECVRDGDIRFNI